ncbi:MAG: SHD1 domain-containing protein [Thermoguttaceae bacterium]
MSRPPCRLLCSFGISLIGFIALVLGINPLFAQERNWTDSSGKFSVLATLLDFDGTHVKIKKQDGRTLTLTMDKLSEEDKSFLKNWQSSLNPFAGGDLEEHSVGTEVEPLKTGKKQSVRLPLPEKLDIAKVHTAIFKVDSNDWSLKPNPLPSRFEKKPKSISLPFGTLKSDQRLFTFPLCFSINPLGKILTTVQGGRFSGERDSVVFVCDTATGRSISLRRSEISLYPLDISPSGKRIVIRCGNREGGSKTDSSRVEFYEINTSGELELIGDFAPFGQVEATSSHSKDVHSAYWIDEEHVLFCSPSKTLLLMNIVRRKPVWTSNDTGFIVYSLSLTPGKKYIAYPTSTGILMIESLTGEVVGAFEDSKTFGPVNLAFSPDGTRLCGWFSDVLTIWDATTGKRLESMTVLGAGQPFWVDDQYILVSGLLVDIKRKVPIWNYGRVSFHDNLTVFGGYVWQTDSGKTGCSVVSHLIPHKEALEIAQKSDPCNYLLTEGSEMMIKLDRSVKEKRSEIEKAIREKCVGNGWKVTSNSPNVLTLKVVEGEEEKVTYRPMFRALSNEKPKEVTFRPNTMLVQLDVNGQMIWSNRKGCSPPPIISDVLSDKDEKKTEQDIVNEYTKPDYDWFLQIRIPNHIYDEKSLGTSKMTPRGLE